MVEVASKFGTKEHYGIRKDGSWDEIANRALTQTIQKIELQPTDTKGTVASSVSELDEETAFQIPT